MLLFYIVVRLKYVVSSLKRRDLIPSIYLQLIKKHEKGIGSQIISLASAKTIVYVLNICKNMSYLNMVECSASLSSIGGGKCTVGLQK